MVDGRSTGRARHRAGPLGTIRFAKSVLRQMYSRARFRHRFVDADPPPAPKARAIEKTLTDID